MITGIYQAATGMSSLVQIQEKVANNLANINTNGFKKELIAVQQEDPLRIHVQGTVSTSSGVPKITDNPYHMALGSAGYFTVDRGDGLAYTRNGDFQLNNQGQLCTTNGFLVMGQNGPIVIDKPDFVVNEAGEVIIDGQVVDRLMINNSDAPLRRLGNTLMVFEDETAVTPLEGDQVKVMQGMLEGSNVNIMESMTEMILLTRMYEANQKSLESQDTSLKQLITEVGKVQ